MQEHPPPARLNRLAAGGVDPSAFHIGSTPKLGSVAALGLHVASLTGVESCDKSLHITGTSEQVLGGFLLDTSGVSRRFVRRGFDFGLVEPPILRFG